MSASNQDDRDLYERRIERLISAVRDHHNADKAWTPTPLRKQLDSVAAKLREVVALMDATDAFEGFHDARPLPEWPPTGDYEHDEDWPLYQDIRRDMLLLEESARIYADALPDARKRRARSFAALGLLHLRHRHGFPPLSVYVDGPHVLELERVCIAAGMPAARETLRNALRESEHQFDPSNLEPAYLSIFQ